MHSLLEDAVNEHLLPERQGAATQPRSNAKLRKVVFGSALGIAPLAVAGAVGWLMRSRRAGLFAGAGSALGLLLYRWQLERSFNDEPDYEVEARIGPLEVRRYKALVEAVTTIPTADVEIAIKRGFDTLASYIFGKNVQKENLGMTAPVTSQSADGCTRIAFIMPMSRGASTLPAPTEHNIQIAERTSRRVAVLAFRGSRKRELIESKAAELRRLVSAAGLTAHEEPTYAGFDPPWTLPFLRRNEVWQELA